ncbi:hypothetical protein BH24ACI2_BH24ACI2_16030 [soil metagenome]|jgi:uncharacterized protein with HEPN domain|nr:hypothetical protein [Acidobacteriota bacterium]
MRNLRYTVLFLITILALTGSFFAQTKKRKPGKETPKPTAAVQPTQKETQPDEVSTPKTQGKKNERPADEIIKSNLRPTMKTENPSVYFYEFSQPNFLVSQIFIEHDENGKGKITFLKKDFSEAVSDPIQLSAAILEKLKTLFNTLNFLESVEVYQSAERNYAHLGTMKIKIKKDGRERTSEFNWTENKDAKNLADEYRKISNQYIWMFDIGVARENQPLESPRIMDALDALIKRGEISDTAQMIPFLKELSDDERIPLIARNHATRLIQQIEKVKR